MDAEYSRRQFLQIAGVTGAAAGREPCLGLIFSRAVPVPADARGLYPSGIRFLAESVGVGSSLPEEFDRLADRIIPAARKLAASGANALVLTPPSLSFYRGAAFNASLSAEIEKVIGLPFITASTALTDSLGTLRARRVAVATAYTEEINLRLQGFLNESGFEVVILRGLGTERFEERAPVTEALTFEETIEFAVKVREDRPEADTLLIAFGSLPTHEMILPLEKRCRIPVVSSVPHALRAGVRLLGIGGSLAGFGTLFDRA